MSARPPVASCFAWHSATYLAVGLSFKSPTRHLQKGPRNWPFEGHAFIDGRHLQLFTVLLE
eukprot:1120267-Lingulodinium_polyedra.AAC.1